MLGVTERAKQVLLQKKLSVGINAPAVGWRLVSLVAGEFTLVVDRVRPGDQVVQHGGALVLLVDAELSEILLPGSTVDCDEGADGRAALLLRAPPNVVTAFMPGHPRSRQRNIRRGRRWPLPGRGPSPPATAA